MELSGQFPVQLLCERIGIPRSSFYHWKKSVEHPSKQKKRLVQSILLFQEYHIRFPSHGYRLAGLQDILVFKKQYPEYKLILHSDQGSVYASKSYNELLPMYNITRSMSRAGTPTDNAAMESINGWIKAELFTDFHITSSENVPEQVSDYIRFFNEERPEYTLGYLTPKQYRERFSPKQEYAAQTTAGDV